MELNLAQENLNPLLFEEQHLIRVIDRGGEPWFVLADVCKALEITNAGNAAARLDEDEKGIHTVDTPGGLQQLSVVSEAGVYSLVFVSRKPAAQRFKRWLAHEVIPAIRKQGFYDARKREAPANDPAEPRPFPDWPMDELRTKRGVVDMYRMLYGTMAAQWVSPQMGFPAPPTELVENGRQFSLTLVPTGKAA